MLWPLLVEVGFHPGAETLDRQRKTLFGPIDPLFRRVRALASCCRPGGDDLISVKLVGIALLHPFQATGLVKRLLEGSESAFLVQIAFHVGDMGMIRTIALHLVQDFEKDGENGLAS